MTEHQPKPGPHLHPSTTPDLDRPVFRTMAKRHAVDAANYLAEALLRAELSADREELLAQAQVAADVSLACSAIAPPSRRHTHRADPPPAPLADRMVEAVHNLCLCPSFDPDEFDGPEDHAAACAICPVHGTEVQA